MRPRNRRDVRAFLGRDLIHQFRAAELPVQDLKSLTSGGAQPQTGEAKTDDRSGDHHDPFFV
jgi:hypothetical protein